MKHRVDVRQERDEEGRLIITLVERRGMEITVLVRGPADLDTLNWLADFLAVRKQELTTPPAHDKLA